MESALPQLQLPLRVSSRRAQTRRCLPACEAQSAAEQPLHATWCRRELAVLTCSLATAGRAWAAVAITEPVVTQRVFFDVSLCDPATPSERSLGGGGGSVASCAATSGVPLGRIVVGLYGQVAPFSVDSFAGLVRDHAYKNTLFSRISVGEYIQAGTPGNARLGQVRIRSPRHPFC